MRYRLRTLMIVLVLGPMVLAGVWYWLSPSRRGIVRYFGGGDIRIEGKSD